MFLKSLAVATIALACSAPTVAAADHGTGDGTFETDTARISVWATNHTDGSAFASGDPDGPRRWRMRVTLDETAGGLFPGGSTVYCIIEINGAQPALGHQYTVDTIDTQSGEVVRSSKRCEPLIPEDVPASALPPTPPTPPTFGEMWESAQIPAPTIGLNPKGVGITGLHTRLWAIGPDIVTVTATVRGYTTTGYAIRTGYRFKFGDGSGVQNTTTSGTSSVPAATRKYQKKGTYTIEVGSLWVASVRVSGPGIPTTTTSLGEAIIIAEHSYKVVEVRSQIIN